MPFTLPFIALLTKVRRTPEPATAVVPGRAPAPAPQPAVVAPVTTEPTGLAALFSPTGGFVYRAVFRFNHLTPVNLQNRRALLELFATCSAAEFHALPFVARQNAFKVLKREYARYKGTATRMNDSQYGRKGEPLPKLAFPTAEDAVAYQQLLERAVRNLARAVGTPV